MTPCAVCFLGVLVLATPAAADPEAPPDDAGAALAEVREHFARGEFAAARDLLLATYTSSHRADLLFALGQAEFNLENFVAAIDYYEQYLATFPDPERTAVTQQALGAARARIAAGPRPAPPPKTVERHHWIPEYTGLVALGGVSLALGSTLIVHGHGLGEDDDGSLADYQLRIKRSQSEQIAGLVATIGGTVAIAGALIAWRVRTETTVVTPTVSERAVGVAIGGHW